MGDKAIVMNADWANESPLIHATLKIGTESSDVTVQYLEPISLGMRLQHYGTKVYRLGVTYSVIVVAHLLLHGIV